jgi:hypothetical protein
VAAESVSQDLFLSDSAANFRYYTPSEEKKPKKMTDAHIIKKSGYELYQAPWADPKGNDYVQQGRYPKAVLGAEAGLLDNPPWPIIFGYCPVE